MFLLFEQTRLNRTRDGCIIMKNLLDVEDLAKYLKLKKQTIYNWLNQRKISGMKIGGVWRFDKQEIDKWLKSQARKSKKRR